jgi:hypothetical protein
VKTTELVTFRRPALVSTLAEVGLGLAEAKALLAELQASVVRSQVGEYATRRRVCPDCEMLRPLKDRRTRRLQTLFGTIEVEAPRFRVCRCRPVPPPAEATVSPVCALLTARCTPELEQVQAELGARTSFREAARILEALLPASPPNHESVRTRTHAVALRLEAADRRAAAETVAAQHRPDKAAVADPTRPMVVLDGAYVRAVPGHRTRSFEAICGKVEHEGHASRRFALVRSVAEPPDVPLRAALLDQGWRGGERVTAISDGDPALPALVRAAAGGPVEHTLDWFHLSMRVRHVEQVVQGLYGMGPPCPLPVDCVQAEVERLRHLLWNGRHDEAHASLGAVAAIAGTIGPLNGPGFERKAGRLVELCEDLRAYVENNEGALIDYGQRYRAGEPISSSRAEGTVNQLVNARMNKRRQMRWSPRGAHRVLQVRAAVLDGRFGQHAVPLAA